MSTKTKLTPQQATTFGQIVSLDRDNLEHGDYALSLNDDSVSLHFMQYGSQRWVNIPREDFDALVRWYTTGATPEEG